jgi:hypothetical protein
LRRFICGAEAMEVCQLPAKNWDPENPVQKLAWPWVACMVEVDASSAELRRCKPPFERHTQMQSRLVHHN